MAIGSQHPADEVTTRTTVAAAQPPVEEPTGRHRAGRGPKWWVAKVVQGLFAALVISAALFPLLWMAISGFKARTEVVRTPFQFLPEVWRLENYQQMLADPQFVRALAITFLGASLFALLTLIVNSMAAYVFARLDFAFKRTLWVFVIMTMFIPMMAIFLTSFLVVAQLRMLDSMAVLVIPGAASAVHIFFIRQFYLSIPTSLEDAARVDGANAWDVFRHIFLPMSKPVFVLVGITSFLVYWNSYVWPILTITSRELFVVQQYLGVFRSERAAELGLLMAGSAIAAMPVIVLFLIFQRFIISGIRLTGIK